MVNFNPAYLFPPLPSFTEALFHRETVQPRPPQPSFTPPPPLLPGIRTLFGSLQESTPPSLPLVVDFQRQETTLPSSLQLAFGSRVTRVHPRVETLNPGSEERWFDTGDLSHRIGCRTCQKMFTQMEDFKRHDRTHTGERPYECDICHDRFIQRGHLTDHKMRRHSSDRTYHCQECPSSFVGKRELRKHMKKHES